MPQKQTAVVVVDKDWLNSAGVRHLVNDGKSSSSTAPAHIFIGPLEDSSNPHGLWLSGITTSQLTKDQSPVTMRLMVPWTVVLAVGVIDGGFDVTGVSDA